MTTFLLNQNQTLELLKSQNETTQIFQHIIRNYHNIFNDTVELDLDHIVRLTNLPFRSIISALKQWHSESNIELHYAQTDIQIQWLVPREDQYTLAPLLQRLEQNQNVKKEKVEAIIEFAYSTKACKQKQILNYFGEKNTQKCMKCNALECSQTNTIDHKLLSELILDHIKENLVSLKELDQSISDYSTFDIRESVRILLENKKVLLTKYNKLKIYS